MSLRRFALTLFGTASVALVAVLPAAAKEGVVATLRTSIPLDAPAGTRLHVAWTLAYVDDEGRRMPFGANGVFVRLHSASGADAEEGVATGAYEATVTVPQGGIGDVEIGLIGWRSDATGTHRADAIFPITNDPVPGRPVASSAAGGARSADAGGSTIWILIVVASFLSVAALLAVALIRRRRRSTDQQGSPRHVRSVPS